MTNDFTIAMLARLVLWLVTVLAARMGQNHRVVVRLFPATAEAEVLRQLVLSVGVVAVRTRPRVESHQSLCCPLGVGHFFIGNVFFNRAVFLHITVAPLIFLLLFFLVVGDVLLE